MAMAAFLANQPEKGDVVVVEAVGRISAEDDARSDDHPLPLDRDCNMPSAGSISNQRVHRLPRGGGAVRVDDDRAALGDDGAGGALGQREVMAGLALDAEVGLFAIGSGSLVDGANRARPSAQQVHGPPEDSLQQRLQRELASKVFDRARQGVDWISRAQTGERVCVGEVRSPDRRA